MAYNGLLNASRFYPLGENGLTQRKVSHYMLFLIIRFKNLLYILHPLGHILVAHVVDILDEAVILLPERHPDLLSAAQELPKFKYFF